MMNGSGSIQSLVDQSKALENCGDIAGALKVAGQAMELAQEQNDAAGQAVSRVQYSYLEFRLGHYAQARRIVEGCLEVSGPLDPARADACLILGNVAAETNSLSEAEAWYLQAADLSRTIGYHTVRMRSQHNLAMGVYFPRGQFDQALAAAAEAYNLTNLTGFWDYLPYPLTTLTWINLYTGELNLARQTLAELGSVVIPGSLHEGYYHFLSGLLVLEDDASTAAAARESFFKARSIAEAIGEPGLNVQARVGLSRCYQAAGDGASGRNWAAEAVETAQRAGYDHMQGVSFIELGRAEILQGNLPAAETHLRQAIATLDALEAGFDSTRAVLELAGLLLEQGRTEARSSWEQACKRILTGGYFFLADRESRKVYPLVAAFISDRDPSLRQASADLLARLNKIAPVPLKVATLGKFEVMQNSRMVPAKELGQRKAGELLALLLFSPGYCLAIEQVNEALWPDKDPAAYQHLLHHATSSLRQALEPYLPARLPSRYLEVEDGQVRLSLPPGSWIDVEAFERHCQKREWEAALALYGGELLPGYLYSEWAALLRQRVSHWVQSALIAVAAERLEAQRFAETFELCQRLLAIEPWHERGAEIGMRACLGLGDPARALRLYRSLERTLRTELDTEPNEALRAWLERSTAGEDNSLAVHLPGRLGDFVGKLDRIRVDEAVIVSPPGQPVQRLAFVFCGLVMRHRETEKAVADVVGAGIQGHQAARDGRLRKGAGVLEDQLGVHRGAEPGVDVGHPGAGQLSDRWIVPLPVIVRKDEVRVELIAAIGLIGLGVDLIAAIRERLRLGIVGVIRPVSRLQQARRRSTLQAGEQQQGAEEDRPSVVFLMRESLPK